MGETDDLLVMDFGSNTLFISSLDVWLLMYKVQLLVGVFPFSFALSTTKHLTNIKIVPNRKKKSN